MKDVKVWSPREDLRFRNMREHKLTYKQIAESTWQDNRIST